MLTLSGDCRHAEIVHIEVPFKIVVSGALNMADRFEGEGGSGGVASFVLPEGVLRGADVVVPTSSPRNIPASPAQDSGATPAAGDDLSGRADALLGGGGDFLAAALPDFVLPPDDYFFTGLSPMDELSLLLRGLSDWHLL
jgi:hypothetical protein